jgi:hypothetical protein
MKNYYVYKITHIPTGKVYVGRKTATEDKFKDYWGSSTHPLFASKNNKKVSERYDKFIEDCVNDYKKDVLELCSDSSVLGKRETYWINFYKEKGLSVNKHDNHKWTTDGLSLKEMYGDKYEEHLETFKNNRIKYNKSEEKRKALSDRMKKNNPMNNEESRKKVGEASRKRLKGKINKKLLESAHTQEARKKRSEKMKLRSALGLNKAFLEANEGKDNNHFIFSSKGTIWIKLGTENKRIKPSELPEWELKGWSKGRYRPSKKDSSK